MKYVLSGDGATSIFTIDENTGDIHATKRLDREVQPYYTLQAQAVDRLTNLPVEPRSEFVVKVQDINDNEPKFADGPYVAGVPEMSPLGRSSSSLPRVLTCPACLLSGSRRFCRMRLQRFFCLKPLFFPSSLWCRLDHGGVFHSGSVGRMMMRNDWTQGAPVEFRTMRSIYSCRAFRRKFEGEGSSELRKMKVFASVMERKGRVAPLRRSRRRALAVGKPPGAGIPLIGCSGKREGDRLKSFPRSQNCDK